MRPRPQARRGLGFEPWHGRPAWALLSALLHCPCLGRSLHLWPEVGVRPGTRGCCWPGPSQGSLGGLAFGCGGAIRVLSCPAPPLTLQSPMMPGARWGRHGVLGLCPQAPVGVGAGNTPKREEPRHCRRCGGPGADLRAHVASRRQGRAGRLTRVPGGALWEGQLGHR